MNTHFFWEDLYEYTHTYVEWYINVRKLLKKMIFFLFGLYVKSFLFLGHE